LCLLATGHPSPGQPGGTLDTDRDGDRSGGSGPPFENTARVSKAAGMVSAQAGCDVERALILMRGRAGESGVTLDDLASGVIDGSIRFGEASPQR
jgi:hypothetical protein